MEKTPRYTASEKRLLLKLIANQKEIIEQKKTDAFTNRSKENAWTVITKSYNSCVRFKRTAKQLRQLYKNMKYAANVNSSTSSLSEMLDILNMQIMNDPNIKAGENVMVPSNSTDTKPLKIYPPQSSSSSLHSTLFPNTASKLQSYLMNNVIKSEILDAEEMENEMISSQSQSNIINSNNKNNPIEPEIDFSQFTATSTTPSSLFQTENNNNPNQSSHELNDIDDDDDDLIDDEDDEIDNMNNLQNLTASITHYSFSNKVNNSNNINHSNNNNLNNSNKISIKPTLNNHVSNTKETLISIAIEERRKKIELLETQIKYWKTLTNKIENCQKICCCKMENFHNRNINSNNNI